MRGGMRGLGMRGGMRGLGMRGGGERERARAPERDRGGDGYEGGRKEGGGGLRPIGWG